MYCLVDQKGWDWDKATWNTCSSSRTPTTYPSGLCRATLAIALANRGVASTWRRTTPATSRASCPWSTIGPITWRPTTPATWTSRPRRAWCRSIAKLISTWPISPILCSRWEATAEATWSSFARRTSTPSRGRTSTRVRSTRTVIVQQQQHHHRREKTLTIHFNCFILKAVRIGSTWKYPSPSSFRARTDAWATCSRVSCPRR